jgi:hypothetical protein
MRFVRQNRFFLLVILVLLFSSIMVLRQFVVNHSAHASRREDFILLHERKEDKTCAWLYQRLIQELPQLDDQSLSEDLTRMSMVIEPIKADKENLAWKYYVSVGKELERRADKRISRVIARAQGQ